MEGAKFTWFPKLTLTLGRVPEEQRGALLWALAQYGTYGVEPELSWPLDAIFESLREDIDNSKRAITSGGRGGRGNKKAASSDSEAPFAEAETPLCESVNPPSDVMESRVCDAGNGGLEDAEPTPLHTSPVHTKTKGVRRFKPPTVEEVREYAASYAEQKGLDHSAFDAERFVDYYASNGWKVGRNAMRDWKAAVRDWVRRDCRETKKGGCDEYSAL